MSNNYKNLVIKAGISLILFFIVIMASSPYRLPLIFILLPALPLIAFVIFVTKLFLLVFHIRQSLWIPIVYVVTLVNSIFIILLSLGQLTFKDFFLLFSLGLVAGFYMSRMFFDDKSD